MGHWSSRPTTSSGWSDFTGAPASATMPQVNGEDLADDTYLAARPAVVARAVSDPRRWALWWPDLWLTVIRRRGVRGIVWTVGGALAGTAEIWLEPCGDGTVLHFYLRTGLTDAQRVTRTLAWKRCAFALKDELEAQGGRPSGR
jgi:hypothetical protein